VQQAFRSKASQRAVSFRGQQDRANPEVQVIADTLRSNQTPLMGPHHFDF